MLIAVSRCCIGHVPGPRMLFQTCIACFHYQTDPSDDVCLSVVRGQLEFALELLDRYQVCPEAVGSLSLPSVFHVV